MAKRFVLELLLIGLSLATVTALAQARQRIAFQRTGSTLAPSNILVMYLDGKTLQDISAQELSQHNDVTGKRVTPALSPDGQTLAFAAQVGQHFQLFTWRLDDRNFTVGGPVRLTQDDTADAKFPAWSPDGTRIAYISTDENGKSSLRMINRDGTSRKVLVDVSYNGSSPSWNSDGQKLLFINKIGQRLVLREIPVLGGMVMDIRPQSTITAACFSPDGKKIAALIRRPDGLSDLWVLTPPGTTGNVVWSKIDSARSVAWPEAQTIIFNAVKVTGQQSNNAFWVFNTRDRSLRNFTGYSEAKLITFFSVQRVNASNEIPTIADIDNTIGPEGKLPRERVPEGAVTIIRPFSDTIVRGMVPIKIIAQKNVTGIVIRINDQFTYATGIESGEDEVPRITYNWDTQQLSNVEPVRGSGIPAVYQDRNKKIQLLRYPDDDYTITVLALERDNQGRDKVLKKDSIKVTVKNSIPDNDLPGNYVPRYQYRETDSDEEFLLHGEGQLYGTDLLSIDDLNATFDAKIRRSLVDTRPNGNYDLRTTLRLIGRIDSYPLTFGLKGLTGIPEEHVSALYTLSPSGDLSVVPQTRMRIFLPLAQVGLTFPGTPVQVGSQWQNQMWIVSDLLGREGVQVRANNVVDGLEWIGEHQTIRIRSDFRLDIQNNVLPLTPASKTPGIFDSTIFLPQNGLKVADSAGVRYTWFDYEHDQVVRVEDFLLYTFPLANVTSSYRQPTGNQNVTPPPYGTNPTQPLPPSAYGANPAQPLPPSAYGVNPNQPLPPSAYGVNPNQPLPPGAYGPNANMGLPPGAMNPGMMPPGVRVPPGMVPPGMRTGGDPPGVRVPPGMVPPGMQTGGGLEGPPPGLAGMRPGVMPPGVTPPTTGIPPTTGMPPRTGTGTTFYSGATQPRMRSGNGYYLVRWSYLIPMEESEEQIVE